MADYHTLRRGNHDGSFYYPAQAGGTPLKKNYDPVLVTGASGFIGGHIVRTLAKRGKRVFAVYRRPDPPAHLKEAETMGVRLIRSDLLEPSEELLAALKEAEGVIHAAAMTGDWASMKKFTESNVVPTQKLLEAAGKAGCRKFVYISSLAVHGFGDHVDSTEEGPYYPLINGYQKTKKTAEEIILESHSPDMATTAIRPGNVYGPGDTTTFFPIFRAMEQRLMGYLGTGETLTCPVYIDDLVDGILRALEEEDAGGEVFNLVSADRATWKDILEYSAQELGIKPPGIRLPRWFARFLAGLLTGVFKALFIPVAPPITFYRVDQLTSNYHFSYAKAGRILGYQPQVRYKTGFRKAAADYLERKAKREKKRCGKR